MGLCWSICQPDIANQLLRLFALGPSQDSPLKKVLRNASIAARANLRQTCTVSQNSRIQPFWRGASVLLFACVDSGSVVTSRVCCDKTTPCASYLSMTKKLAQRRRFSAICALFLGAVLFSAHINPLRAAGNELSPKDRASVFDDVWKNVRDRYYDPEFHGVNWEEVGNRYRLLLEGVKNDQEFYALVNRMTVELHDAHTRFNSPEAWENRDKDLGVIIGFMTAERDGLIVVTDVYPDSNAADAGIEPGMIVLTVNAKPVADLIAEAAKTVLPTSTERATRRRILASVYKGSAGTVYKIGLQRADGTTFN